MNGLLTKIRREGFTALIRRRLAWYGYHAQRRRPDHWIAGRMREICGNRARIHGLDFSLDSPMIPTRLKHRGFLAGYELPERDLAHRHIPRDRPVIELGGSIGVISCVVNRLLSDPAAHVAVEASPEVLPTLAVNRDLNGCRFEILPGALAYGADTVKFYLGENLHEGSLVHRGGRPVDVRAHSLESIADGRRWEEFSVICDIEGAELDLVDNELEVLSTRAVFLLMEIHPAFVGTEETEAMLARLRQVGFVERERREDVFAFENSRLSGS